MQTKLLIPLLFTSLYAQSLSEIANLTINNNFKLKSFIYKIKADKYKIKQSKDNYYPSLTANLSAAKDKYYYEYPNTNIKYNSTVYH